jgi:hypothetical protein
MECHYCDRGADVAVEKGHVTVGLCETHFQEQMEALADAEWFDDLDDQLDVDSPE